MIFQSAPAVGTVPAPSAQVSHLAKIPHHPSQPAHFHALAIEVARNLLYQHDWSDLKIHNISPISSKSLPRPLLSGVPPRRVYVHPDDQVDEIRLGIKEDSVEVDREWVLPTRLREKWSLSRFGDCFDAIEVEPQTSGEGIEAFDGRQGTQHLTAQSGEKKTKHTRKVKRLLLATISDDSTVVYYIVHDGIVRPRQN